MNKKKYNKHMTYDDDDSNDLQQAQEYSESAEDEPVTKKVVNVAESFKQRRKKMGGNVIGAKMKCDENGCHNVEDSDEIFSPEESGSLWRVEDRNKET